MENFYEEKLIKNLEWALYRAYLSAKKIHDIATISNTKAEYPFLPMYISDAVSEMCVAKAVYYSRLEVLDRTEVDEIIIRFDRFIKEVSKNYRTEHSHQWTDLEFTAYEDYYLDTGLKPVIPID